MQTSLDINKVKTYTVWQREATSGPNHNCTYGSQQYFIPLGYFRVAEEVLSYKGKDDGFNWLRDVLSHEDVMKDILFITYDMWPNDEFRNSIYLNCITNSNKSKYGSSAETKLIYGCILEPFEFKRLKDIGVLVKDDNLELLMEL
jgi:hypothetical protein